MRQDKGGRAPTGKEQFERLSLFRYELRQFLRFSENACRAEGVTMLQYQLLLHTQGFPDREWASIGEIAERLQSQPHGAVALVDRCQDAGLVRRKASETNGRLVEVHLTPRGRRCLERLAKVHRQELRELAAVIEAAQAGAE
ncbi:MAG TPA: MarR family transcriptional regulator [Ramlibacter sp.]|nr:MarR family transcriptional regulator [Ramlibacter sp.]